VITFGHDLYRLTSRDEETLLVDPYFRSITVNVATLTTGGTGLLAPPQDRAYMLNRLVVRGASMVGASWQRFQLLTQGGGSATHVLWDVIDENANGLTGDNAAPPAAAGQTVIIGANLNLLIPPGLQLLAQVSRNAAPVAAGLATFWLTGFLVPPGGIGRAA